MNPPNNAPYKELPSSLSAFIWQYLKNKKRYLFGFILISLIWAGEMSLSPYLLKVIIDIAGQYSQNPSKFISAILVPAGLYVFMSFFLNFTFRFYNYLNLRLNPEIKASVTLDMFEYLMHHSQSFFEDHFSGSLARKIFDMGAYIDQVIGIINEFFYPRVIAMLIACITLSAVVKPIFGIILFIWAISFMFLSYLAAKKTENIARITSETAAKMSGTLSDSITNIISTKIFANTHYEIDNLSNDVESLVSCDRQLQWKNLIFNFIQGLGVTVLIAAMITTLVYGSIHGWVTPGDFAMVLMLSISFIMSIYSIGQQMLTFSKIVGICNQALSFIRVPHEIIDLPLAKPIDIKKGEITFNNVSFQYENNQPLFENINLNISAGEKIGLVGYSGGGKSTFIKLILRLIDVNKGSLLIDGQDIKHVTQASLRKQIATIPQQTELFHRSIMENIRFAHPSASNNDVIDAATKAGCHEFISELPEQYESMVGERGIKLSGGQKQRIAIARAFLKNAPILILDEATSALDSVTEQHIKTSLHEIMSHKTTIVIAHRLSTLKDMNRIIVFVKGKIVEDGSMEELLKDTNSHFYHLWKMQSDGFLPSLKT